MRTARNQTKDVMNLYQAELDGLNLGVAEVALLDQKVKPLALVSLLTAGLAENQPSNETRKPLHSVLAEVIFENELKMKVLQTAETLRSVKGKHGVIHSLRVLVDFWSSSEESSLRENLELCRTLLEESAAETQLELLACVYPARGNRRFYSALEELFEEEEHQRHSLSYAPRSDTLGKLFRSTTGLSSSVYSFLAI